ncbi:MAG: UDP-N-acetylmuramoyl-L-alanyl-D-glutamate--2,6-diaminopimelate ligase [Acidobacteria bacterium]|nr:UDP-N-acetylmuramoyl-L-alanyl-D-glutamate--2,6-diaminopimelate ligase [Acidobacteriota bacterium]
MQFLDLLNGAEIQAHRGNPPVRGVAYDSRRVEPGDIFVALGGQSSDGNRFIGQAIAAGAVAIVSESDREPEGAAWARVVHARRALATISANLFRRPADELPITGITGTNGKSTTAFLLESIFAAAGRSSLLVGTIEYHVAGAVRPALHTTPEALELHGMFRESIEAGAREAVVEVSSHALAQQRTYGIPFEVAVFTNLTRDHLDYHCTMDQYFHAKRLLFEGEGARAPRVSVLNLDDERGRELVKFSHEHGSRVLTYGRSHADFRAANLKIGVRETRFDLVTPDSTLPIATPLVGMVNVYNILAASAAGCARGCPPVSIVEGVARLASVPGRFERIDHGQSFTVVVDYAHTDDALQNLTSVARQFVEGEGGRVITVFGCGGGRDRSKRPLMGEAAGRGSDFVVITSDNPRAEDPLAIINDALVGLERSGTKYHAEPDRRAAIHIAIKSARRGDIVLIAGKGHERVQAVAGRELPFEDKKIATEALLELGYDGRSVGAENRR